MKQPANNEVLLRGDNGQWLYFRSPYKVLCARTYEDVISVLEEASEWDGWAAGYLSYEAAPAFDSALPAKESVAPLAWFGLYDAPEEVEFASDLSDCHFNWIFDTDESRYESQIKQIKDYIREGETYQVNHTIRLKTRIADAWKFFLDKMSEAEFSAYIQTGDLAICSASPELFFQLEGDDITCRPMKGTGRDAHDLAASLKDRVENIMIVDMIRNDLGHICYTGSIVADSLFAVQPFDRIWQMTSTVKGESSVDIPEIFKALFPCASITGAPKCRTMQIIKELENSPRNVYCGAIGYIAPERKARFSVAIRTAEVDRSSGDAVYGVGGGIVWDSQTDSEWNECALKAEILGNIVGRASLETGGCVSKVVGRASPAWPEPVEGANAGGRVSSSLDFQLLETMLYDNGIAYLDEHIERLSRSAAELGFDLNIEQLKIRLDSITGERQRLRLLLSRNGEITVESFSFPEQDEPLRTLAFSKDPVDPENPLLYHKTTMREIYNHAKASVPDVDDVILWNNRGEVTESAIANIVAEIDGKLVTPPVECGLLPGSMRAALLKEGEISERIISIEKFRVAQRIFLINSLRGWMPAQLRE